MNKVKYVDNPNRLQSEIKELEKMEVFEKNLHETKKEIVRDFIGEFELFGNLAVGDQIRETHIRFIKNTDYEAYITSIDEGY